MGREREVIYVFRALLDVVRICFVVDTIFKAPLQKNMCFIGLGQTSV